MKINLLNISHIFCQTSILLTFMSSTYQFKILSKINMLIKLQAFHKFNRKNAGLSQFNLPKEELLHHSM